MRQLSLAFSFCFFLTTVASAQDKSTTVRKYSSDEGREITLEGPFVQSKAVKPGDFMMTKSTKSKSPLFMLIESVNFVGRTGEKTFEIGHKAISVGMNMNDDHKITKFYFVANDTANVPGMYLGDISKAYIATCKDEELGGVKLKMLRLDGNSLVYRIMLPACLKAPDKNTDEN